MFFYKSGYFCFWLPIFLKYLAIGHWLLAGTQRSLTYWEDTQQKRRISNYSKSKSSNKEQTKLLRANRWMPWLSEAKKDVTSCEKLRGGANNL